MTAASVSALTSEICAEDEDNSAIGRTQVDAEAVNNADADGMFVSILFWSLS